MFKQTSLKNKALAFAIALGTLPVIVCGSINYYLTYNNIKNSEIKSQESRTNSLSNKVNRFLFERYGDIQIISNLAVLSNPKQTAGFTPQAKQKILNQQLILLLW